MVSRDVRASDSDGGSVTCPVALDFCERNTEMLGSQNITHSRFGGTRMDG
jgi:hypothetical protein